MSFTYSGDPAESKLAECRFLIGDTDDSNPIMQDEEINYLIAEAGQNDIYLKYLLFSQAATIFSRAIKRSLGPQSEDPTSRLNYLTTKATEYKRRLSSKSLSLPNVSYPKVFSKGMHSNPPWRKR